MKAFDPQGEYTAEEVRAALIGADNTRTIEYRYDRLDRYGNFVEPIDYVQKATIENNNLADIKRTAKFDMIDTGSFNFLQDRIKPYARIVMPADGNYYERVRTLAPAVWWKFDESPTGLGLPETLALADNTNYQTRETAYIMATRASGVNAVTANGMHPDFPTGSESNRAVLWIGFENTSANPLKIELYPSTQGNVTSYSIYYTPTLTAPLSLLTTGTFSNSAQTPKVTYSETEPKRGYYYVEQTRVYSMATSEVSNFKMEVSRTTRITDSSGNNAYGLSDSLNLGGERLIKSADTAASVADSSNLFGPGWRLAGSFLHNDPYNEEPRDAQLITTGQYLGMDNIVSRGGDKFYIEFIARPHNLSGLTNYPQINAGIFLTTAASGEGPGWVSSTYNGGVTKLAQLENGWAKYAATPYIDPSWDTVANAKIAFRIDPVGIYTSQDWLIDSSSVQFIKRANSGYASGAADKSLMPVSGKNQTWVTPDSMNLSMGTAISLNYWQRLGQSTNPFASSVTFNMTGGTIQLSSSHVTGQDAVFSVVITEASVYNTYTYTGTLSVRESLFDSKAHMITFRIDPKKGTAVLYVDASKIGDFVTQGGSAAFSETAKLLNGTNVIGKITSSFTTTSTVANYIDDLTVYPRAIELYDLQDLVTFGKNSKPIRRGWVEWPLGVFVLSAPSRTMVEGNTVIRNVEAYDQLLVLSEDTYSDRFAVAVNAKYTSAIEEIVQTCLGTQVVTAESSVWSITGTVVAATPSVITFTGAGRYEAATVPVMLRGSSLSAAVPNATSFQFGYLAPAVGSLANSLHMKWEKSGSMLNITGQLGTLFSTTYSSTTHAYLRIRESADKDILFETSTNGTTWTLQYTHNYCDAVTGVLINPDIKGTTRVMFGAVIGSTGTVTAYTATGVVLVPVKVTSSAATLPVTMDWEPGTPKLKVINDLLSAINYDDAKFNSDGIFVGEPYVSPTDRPAEFKYITDSESIITGDVNQTIDLFNIPNVITYVVSRPESTPLVSTYVNSDPTSVTSTVSRGRRIVEFRTETEAASQSVLDAKVRRAAIESSQLYEHIEFRTGIMPIHENADVYNVVITDLVINDKYAETSWSMELTAGAVMTHKVRRLVYLP